jgi:phage repressor protein C with HTH and peptisase S24 domain
MMSKAKRPLPPEERADNDRLKAIWNSKKAELRLNQELLADAMDVGQSAVSHYLNGYNRLNAKAAARFAEVLKVKVSDFSPSLALEIERMAQTGLSVADDEDQRPTPPPENHTQLGVTDSGQPKESGGNVITADFQKARLREGEITIPQFDVRGAMGAGQVAPDYVETIRHLTLHQDYLSALGVRYTQASNLAIVTGYGQSMEGTINDGDPVIIDRGVQTFMGDGVYLLTWNDMLYIKRLQMVSATEIELISDNPKHKDRVVKLDEVTVHAKVLIAWNARKL